MNLPHRPLPGPRPGRRHGRPPRARAARAAGFSLIELMAVIVILSILLVFLVPRLMGLRTSAEERLARSGFVAIETAIAEYEGEFGDWPPSKFSAQWGSAPNETNLGSETLVLSLWSNAWGGTSLDPEALVNLDDDRSKKDLTDLLGRELLELADPWGNPIAYFHRQDYGRKDLYVTESPETGERIESTAEARKSATTGKWARPLKFQLVSAGLDGRFGTEDDIYNFGEQ